MLRTILTPMVKDPGGGARRPPGQGLVREHRFLGSGKSIWSRLTASNAVNSHSLHLSKSILQQISGSASSVVMSFEDNHTWDTHPADESGCEALSSRGHHMRTPEMHQKSSKINDLENEPGHVLKLPEVSRDTREDI